VRFVAKKLSRRARLDRYRRDLEDLLAEAESDPLLDREQRFILLCSNIGGILPILLGLCEEIVREAVAQSDIGRSLAGRAERMSVAIRDLIEINRSAEAVGDIDHDAPPAGQRLEQLRSNLVHLLGRLTRDRGLDRAHRLAALRANIDNILVRLRVQAVDNRVGASDVEQSLIGAAKQMLAMAKDLIKLNRAIMARRH
jgi:hypothetical protein